MMKRFAKLTVLAVSMLTLAMSAFKVSVAGAQDVKHTVIIGTGGVTGVYFPVGGAICRSVNKRTWDHGIKCLAESTDGSVDNLNRIRAGDLIFGIVQSDAQYYGLKGFGPFHDAGPDAKLRSVLSLFPEIFTVVARADAGIRTLDHLKGRRVNIGNPGSGHRTTMDLVMLAKGWTQSDFAEVRELPSEQQAAALCAGQIDAFVFVAGHPNASIKEAVSGCGAVLVNVLGPYIEQMVEKYPYLVPAVIRGGTYASTPTSTASFGLSATLVTSADTPDDVVYEVVHSVFRDWTDFVLSHPAFFAMLPQEMPDRARTAPVHPGAQAYFEACPDLVASRASSGRNGCP